MRRILWLLLALLTTATQAGRLTTFAWDSDPSWPPGTTIELCGTGDVCATGIVGTQHALDLPVDPGDVISGRARAVPPAGYQCGDPPALCQPSAWATVAATWPANQVGLWATHEKITSMAATIVGGSVAKATLSNNRTISLSNYTINSGTDLALFVIWCGNYPVNRDEGIATWNPGTAQSLTEIVKDTTPGSSYGVCKVFVKTNPAPGTGTITFSATGGTADEDNLIYAFVVSGVNQTTPTADAAGDTAGTVTSKTLTVPNMTANDLAVAAISIDNSSATVSITAGNNIGTDSTDFVSAWTDAGAAYSTGTGNVNITFGKASANGGALRFRIVGASGGSQTYNHTASGGLASGGTSAIKRTQTATASGGLTINGAAALKKGAVYLATGGIITAGAADASLQSSSQNSHIASGGLVAGGEATVKRTWDYSGGGEITIGGIAGLKRTQIATASGGLMINGAATLHKGAAYLATGGVITAGSADASLQSSSQNSHVASGGLVAGGAATVKRAWDYSASGGLISDGTAAIKRTQAVNASGGLMINGAADASLQSSSQNSHVASGGLAAGGTAALRFLLDHRAVGSVVLSGTAAISYASLAMLLPSGVPAIERTTLLTEVVRATLLPRVERM